MDFSEVLGIRPVAEGVCALGKLRSMTLDTTHTH